MNSTINGINAEQRDIVFVPFPFTDMSSVKKRPVLVLSGKKYNSDNEDRVCCALTCNPNRANKGIKITNNDLDEGHLDFKSFIIPCKIFTSHKNTMLKTIGKLSIAKSKDVVKYLNLNISIDE